MKLSLGFVVLVVVEGGGGGGGGGGGCYPTYSPPATEPRHSRSCRHRRPNITIVATFQRGEFFHFSSQSSIVVA